eukprot:scaffold11601_cov31-Tisochrysis_lutea.AAC.1
MVTGVASQNRRNVRQRRAPESVRIFSCQRHGIGEQFIISSVQNTEGRSISGGGAGSARRYVKIHGSRVGRAVASGALLSLLL